MRAARRTPNRFRRRLTAHHRRGHQQCEDHLRRLQGVGPVHRQEATDEGVEDIHRRAGTYGNPNTLLKRRATDDDARGTVDCEERQGHPRREHEQQALVVGEAGKVVRQRRRVAGALGIEPQRLGHATPVAPSADDRPDRLQAYIDPVRYSAASRTLINQLLTSEAPAAGAVTLPPRI